MDVVPVQKRREFNGFFLLFQQRIVKGPVFPISSKEEDLIRIPEGCQRKTGFFTSTRKASPSSPRKANPSRPNRPSRRPSHYPTCWCSPLRSTRPRRGREQGG